MNVENYKLNDDVISHIAKALQVALLTGTDIVDNLRLIELTPVNGNLVLTPECQENFNTNINSMVENIPSPDSPFSS